MEHPVVEIDDLGGTPTLGNLQIGSLGYGSSYAYVLSGSFGPPIFGDSYQGEPRANQQWTYSFVLGEIHFLAQSLTLT